MNLKELSKEIKLEIDNYCAEKYDEGPRSHLGASEIGHSCLKYLWLKFRWIAHKKHDGRQQRLFQRGHFEEPRFVSYLEGIGFEVQMFAKALFWHQESESYLIEDIDWQKDNFNIDAQHCVNVTDNEHHIQQAKLQGVVWDKGKMQIRMSGCKGHLGGSCDGIAEYVGSNEILEEFFGTKKCLTEFKTNGTGKKWEALCKNGVKEEKPLYKAQMDMYGYKFDLEYGIYLSVNKNDDDLYPEVIKLDHEHGKDLERKAEMIIFSQEPPNGVGCNPSYYECSWCDFKAVCYEGQEPLRNCRSCANCRPVDKAEWECKHYGIVPKEHIASDKPCWESLI